MFFARQKAPPNSDETNANIPTGPSYADTSNASVSPPTELAPNTGTVEANDTAAVNQNPNIINNTVVSSSNVEEKNTENLLFVLTDDLNNRNMHLLTLTKEQTSLISAQKGLCDNT